MAGVKIIPPLEAKNPDILRQIFIYKLLPAVNGDLNLPGAVEMYHLSESMHAPVGSTGGMNGYILLKKIGQRSL